MNTHTHTLLACALGFSASTFLPLPYKQQLKTDQYTCMNQFSMQKTSSAAPPHSSESDCPMPMPTQGTRCNTSAATKMLSPWPSVTNMLRLALLSQFTHKKQHHKHLVASHIRNTIIPPKLHNAMPKRCKTSRKNTTHNALRKTCRSPLPTRHWQRTQQEDPPSKTRSHHHGQGRRGTQRMMGEHDRGETSVAHCTTTMHTATRAHYVHPWKERRTGAMSPQRPIA